MYFPLKYIILYVVKNLSEGRKSWQKLQKAICHTLAIRHITE